MVFLENLFLFPIRLLMKILQILWPLILLIMMLVLFVSYPFLILCFLSGFLIAPVILRKTGIYHVDVTNALAAIALKNQELRQLEGLHQMQIEKTSKTYERKIQRLHTKTQKLKEETMQLDKNYTQLVERKPDQIRYVQPSGLGQWFKTRFIHQGGH